jgi:hypothetical protein
LVREYEKDMALPGLAQVGRMLAHGAAASTNQHIRFDWNRFQNQLKCRTLRLCFIDSQRTSALPPTPFVASRILIDGIVGMVSVAFSTVLCVGVPIISSRRPSSASSSSFNPWSTLNQLQELILQQACTSSVFRAVSLTGLACASFVIDACHGCPRVAMMALLPNINGILPHRFFARARPLQRALIRVKGVFLSQILRVAFCSLCLSSSEPSFKMCAKAFVSSLPLRLLGVIFLEFGRSLIFLCPSISQFVTTYFAQLSMNDAEEDARPEDQVDRHTEALHLQLARSGLVFHPNHLSVAPVYLIEERIVGCVLVRPFVFNAELRSWHRLLLAFGLAERELPGFWKSLFFDYWLNSCAHMLQNGCIASSLVLNELTAYFWADRPN